LVSGLQCAGGMRVLRGLALVAGLIVLMVLVVRSGAGAVRESVRAVSPPSWPCCA